MHKSFFAVTGGQEFRGVVNRDGSVILDCLQQWNDTRTLSQLLTVSFDIPCNKCDFIVLCQALFLRGP